MLIFLGLGFRLGVVGSGITQQDGGNDKRGHDQANHFQISYDVGGVVALFEIAPAIENRSMIPPMAIYEPSSNT